MREPDKTCPACGLICAPWEERCDCGHAFEMTERQRQAAKEREERGCLLALTVFNPVLGLTAFLSWLLVRWRRWRSGGGSQPDNRGEEPER